MQVYVCVCLAWRSVIAIVFVTRRSKCVRGMQRNTHTNALIHRGRITEKKKDKSG